VDSGRAELRREQPPLTFGQHAEMAHLRDLKAGEKLARTVAAPAPLAHEQLTDRPGRRLGR
jgi:hypothetical protein